MRVFSCKRDVWLVGGLALILLTSALFILRGIRRFDRDSGLNSTGPTWQGILVGTTTEDELEQILGLPTSVEHLSDGTSVSFYQVGENRYYGHEVTIHQGVVDSIRETMLGYTERVPLSQFIDQYGTPDVVAWSQTGITIRIIVFLDEGILLVAGSSPIERSNVVTAYYYQPCSLRCVRAKFEHEFGRNPNSLRRYIFDRHTFFSGPEDPWGFTE